MKNIWRVIASVLCVIVLAGCEAKLDTTTDETTKASSQKIQKNMTPEESDRFQNSLKVLVFSNINIGAALMNPALMESQTASAMKSINGLTAKQINDKAAVIIAAQKEKERVQALQEISELEQVELNAQKSQAEIEKFEVIKSRFTKTAPGKYEISPNIHIDLTVKNGTGVAVKRAYFLGVIASAGRSVPWIRETFNYDIPGGLEPGESADWSLRLNPYSEWGKVEAPADAVFTALLVRLDDPDGNPIFDITGLSDDQAKRLEKLRQQYSQ